MFYIEFMNVLHIKLTEKTLDIECQILNLYHSISRHMLTYVVYHALFHPVCTPWLLSKHVLHFQGHLELYKNVVLSEQMQNVYHHVHSSSTSGVYRP